ncbi:hypothetical protein FPV67DRAFT_1557818 [Lyophyllum atratum]|nr:hypothetical protein FPV67DRAFT_1557818 [Lyophyllum atratum]
MDALLSTPSRIVRSLSRPQVKSPGIFQMLYSLQRDYVVGIVLLLVVVLLWSASNFVTQELFHGGFDKPFLVTYLNTSSFSLYLLPFLAKRRWRQQPWSLMLNTNRSKQNRNGWSAELLKRRHSPSRERPHPSPPLTVKETINLAFVFCFLWFIANWTLNASLSYTSVASATILSSMSGLFTLAIGRIFLEETLTFAKVLAVFTSFGGVLLVSLSDSDSSTPPNPQRPLLSEATERPLLGDILALISALVYALYVILLKFRIRTESRIDMRLFFGFVGLFNVLTCWVIGVILHLSGIEQFELPTTSAAIQAILINMFFTLTSDYLYVLAMLKTTPLVVTIGLSLTIPIAVIGDFFLGKTTRALVLIGAFLVIVSFVIVGLDDAKMRSQKEESLATEDFLGRAD